MLSSQAAYGGIEDNLGFLLIEVEKQLARAERFWRTRDDSALSQILASDDYIDNLTATIQGKALSLATEQEAGASESFRFLKAHQVVSLNLERIADFCERFTDQLQYVEDEAAFARFDFGPFFAQVGKGLRQVKRAMRQHDTGRAQTICRAERRLDALYTKTFSKVLKGLSAAKSPQTLLTVLFMAHYLERMGDSLLNIGEAILSASLGERVRFERLETLEASLETLEFEDLGDVELRTMGETKSGATVASLSGVAEAPSLILKEGKTKKLVGERRSVRRWNELVPGLAPRIHNFQKGGVDSAVIFEFVSGTTFEDYLMSASEESTQFALQSIASTISGVWRKTQRKRQTSAGYVEQMRQRLTDVYAVHPEFDEPPRRLGDLQILSTRQLIDAATTIDSQYPAPFSSFIHGDFNVDNMLFDSASGAVHFIDLHRSRETDYVQDVSVFLVSNLRLQVFDKKVRRRIQRSTLGFYRFAREFAWQEGDRSFDLRLALGMARSFLTSTRFVLDDRLARSMYHRSRYLLQDLIEVDCQGRLDDYRLPREVLVD